MKKLYVILIQHSILTLILLSFFAFACSSSDNPLAPHEHDVSELPDHDHPTPPLDPNLPVIESEALAQLFNMNQPDELFNIITTTNDSGVVSFQTSLEFSFKGAPNTLITVVRGVEISHQRQDGEGITSQILGTSIGTIVNANGVEVITLNPAQTYFYLVTWDGETFPFVLADGSEAVYTNFYAFYDGSGSSSVSKRTGRLPVSTGSVRKFF